MPHPTLHPIPDAELFFLDGQFADEWDRLDEKRKHEICVTASWSVWEVLLNHRQDREEGGGA